jgi:glycosyltransferase involved in cell wall biosynthesis
MPSAPQDAALAPGPGRDRAVTVIIPCWNGAGTLLDAVRSVLDQDYAPLEVIVVDDASTDGSPELLAGLGDQRVRWLRLARRSGPGHARNRGLEAGRGHYAAFLDADDLWLPGKLRRQVELLEERPELALVSCDSHYIAADGRPLRTSHQSRPPARGVEAWKTLLAYNFMPTSTVLARREELIARGGFAEHLEIGEDLDLWIRMTLGGDIGMLEEPLVCIREWAGSHTSRCGCREAERVVPLVESYLERERNRLSDFEITRIRAYRYRDSAISLLYTGRPLESLRYFSRAMRSGYGRRDFLRYLPRIALGLATGGQLPRRYH